MPFFHIFFEFVGLRERHGPSLNFIHHKFSGTIAAALDYFRSGRSPNNFLENQNLHQKMWLPDRLSLPQTCKPCFKANHTPKYAVDHHLPISIRNRKLPEKNSPGRLQTLSSSVFRVSSGRTLGEAFLKPANEL